MYSETDSVVLLRSFLCGFFAVIMMLMVCEAGQRCNKTFNDICESYYQVEWNMYPIEVQKMFILIIPFAQKPTEFKFFGSSSCSREQFDGRRYCLRIESFAIVHLFLIWAAGAGYSYFMVLQKFCK